MSAATPRPRTAPAPSATVTRRLARHLAEAGTHELPRAVERLAALHLLDTLASIVACRDLRAGEVARAYAGSHGHGDVPVLGTPDRAPLLDAAFASAIIAHGAEINDFSPSAFVQPGPSVVSTALCLGLDRERTGAEVMRAIVAGYEIACRMPKAIGIPTLRRHGVANHGIGSLFGAATTAATLLRFDEQHVVDLVALCAQQASGSWQWLLDVEHLEKSFVFGGMGVHNGLHAALLVEAGFTGVPDALDVDGGWLAGGMRAGADSHELEYLVDGFGTSFEIDMVGFKRYPVGGPVQPIVKAVLEIVDDETDRDIARIVIEMPGAATTFANARMPALNARYLTALIVIDGTLDFVAAQSLDRFRNDERVRELMERVTVVHDPSQETVPRSESATVTFEFGNGRSRSVHVDHVRGYPSHPMTADDVISKAEGLLSAHFDAAEVAHIVETTLSIGQLESVQPIVDAIERR